MNLKLIKILIFFVVTLDAFTKTENEKNARRWKITKNVSIPRLIFDRKFLCISKWESSLLLLESVYHKKLYKSPTKKGKKPAVNPWKSTFTVFENHPKCLYDIFPEFSDITKSPFLLGLFVNVTRFTRKLFWALERYI